MFNNDLGDWSAIMIEEESTTNVIDKIERLILLS